MLDQMTFFYKETCQLSSVEKWSLYEEKIDIPASPNPTFSIKDGISEMDSPNEAASWVDIDHTDLTLSEITRQRRIHRQHSKLSDSQDEVAPSPPPSPSKLKKRKTVATSTRKVGKQRFEDDPVLVERVWMPKERGRKKESKAQTLSCWSIFNQVVQVLLNRVLSLFLSSVMLKSYVIFVLIFLVPTWISTYLKSYIPSFPSLPPYTLTLSSFYCSHFGFLCTLPYIHPSPLNLSYYASSATSHAQHLGAITSGLSRLTHPVDAPLHADSASKLGVHILEGSTYPERHTVATAYKNWATSLRDLEGDLFTASGVLRIRIDAIIEGVTALKTMLEHPKKYPSWTLAKAHERFLEEFDEHLEEMRKALNGPRERGEVARQRGLLAYHGAEKVVGHVNRLTEKSWRWFPSISGPGKSAIQRELELAHHTHEYTNDILEDISKVHGAIMAMLADISAKRAEGAKQFHLHRHGLQVEDAIKVLERYIERAESDRRGLPPPVKPVS